MITDVSDGGARLLIEGLDIPTDLAIEFASGERRECRVAWRLGSEVGVQFLDGAPSGFGKRIAYAR
jgi:hypothetical protein